MEWYRLAKWLGFLPTGTLMKAESISVSKLNLFPDTRYKLNDL